jgi:hypothetical protein
VEVEEKTTFKLSFAGFPKDDSRRSRRYRILLKRFSDTAPIDCTAKADTVRSGKGTIGGQERLPARTPSSRIAFTW